MGAGLWERACGSGPARERVLPGRDSQLRAAPSGSGQPPPRSAADPHPSRMPSHRKMPQVILLTRCGSLMPLNGARATRSLGECQRIVRASACLRPGLYALGYAPANTDGSYSLNRSLKHGDEHDAQHLHPCPDAQPFARQRCTRAAGRSASFAGSDSGPRSQQHRGDGHACIATRRRQPPHL